ncbi:MAG TPA: phosphotransferase [Micromonosporaceae bacterium]
MDGLGEHLRDAYDIDVTSITRLDLDVHRVDRADGPSWVARVFANRSEADVGGDGEILDRLAAGGFPAERRTGPVTIHSGHPVLVTEFVEGVRPRPGPRVLGGLGALLGALHSRSADGVRPGGGWHHLTPQGDPSAEIEAALELAGPVSATLAAAAAELDDCADLPHCFVHPDLVPANTIATTGHLTIVDWAGAGRGPRLWSLAPLLLVAGSVNLDLIDTVMERYRQRSEITEPELARLADVLTARPLLLDIWSVAHGRMPEARAVAAISARRGLAERIAQRARAASDAN